MSYIYWAHFLMFLDHTQRRSTVGRTPLDEWSARRKDLYLTTHDTGNEQITMHSVGFEPRSQQVSGFRLYIHIYIYINIYIYMQHPFLMFLDHTQRRSTVGRTPLDKWSARRTDLYLTTHNTRNEQISMPPVEFEPTISAGERLAAIYIYAAPILYVSRSHTTTQHSR